MLRPINLFPERIGVLSADEAADFSTPIDQPQRFYKLGVELNDVNTDWPNCLDGTKFALWENSAQFISVVGTAVSHEREVRGARKLSKALLTIRQSMVAAGDAQQKGSRSDVLHRDISGLEGEARMYVVSDTRSTQFYPQIDSVPGGGSEHRLSGDSVDQPYVDFAPYDIVHASGMVYHRFSAYGRRYDANVLAAYV